MKFRTELLPVPSSPTIHHDHPILSIGSCFSDHILQKLNDHKFQTIIHPFGTTYNPLSMADQLKAISQERKYDVVDLEHRGDTWVSFDHHGMFSNTSAKEVLANIETQLNGASKLLNSYRWTFLSLGTAWAWFRSNKAVNNCHQFPDSDFDFRLLSIEEMYATMQVNLTDWQVKNPDNQIIITVSPVRHLRNGMVENNRSKARLIELAHLLAESIQRCTYYPSYELLLDDLRDYRFFDSTLTHPSQQAIEYIWEHFKATFISEHTKESLKAFESFKKALNHRPRVTSGSSFDAHLSGLEKKLNMWMQRWPNADWRSEKMRLNELIKLT